MARAVKQKTKQTKNWEKKNRVGKKNARKNTSTRVHASMLDIRGFTNDTIALCFDAFRILREPRLEVRGYEARPAKLQRSSGTPGAPASRSSSLSCQARRSQQQQAPDDFGSRQTSRLLALRQVLQERLHTEETLALRVRQGAVFQLPALRLQLQIREEPQGAHKPPSRRTVDDRCEPASLKTAAASNIEPPRFLNHRLAHDFYFFFFFFLLAWPTRTAPKIGLYTYNFLFTVPRCWIYRRFGTLSIVMIIILFPLYFESSRNERPRHLRVFSPLVYCCRHWSIPSGRWKKKFFLLFCFYNPEILGEKIANVYHSFFFWLSSISLKRKSVIGRRTFRANRTSYFLFISLKSLESEKSLLMLV